MRNRVSWLGKKKIAEIKNSGQTFVWKGSCCSYSHGRVGWKREKKRSKNKELVASNIYYRKEKRKREKMMAEFKELNSRPLFFCVCVFFHLFQRLRSQPVVVVVFARAILLFFNEVLLSSAISWCSSSSSSSSNIYSQRNIQTAQSSFNPLISFLSLSISIFFWWINNNNNKRISFFLCFLINSSSAVCLCYIYLNIRTSEPAKKEEEEINIFLLLLLLLLLCNWKIVFLLNIISLSLSLFLCVSVCVCTLLSSSQRCEPHWRAAENVGGLLLRGSI